MYLISKWSNFPIKRKYIKVVSSKNTLKLALKAFKLDTQKISFGIVLVPLSVTLNIFYILFHCFCFHGLFVLYFCTPLPQALFPVSTVSQLYVFIVSHTCFRVNLNSIAAWMSRSSLLETGAISELLSECNRNWTHNHLVCEQTLNHLAKLAKLLSCVVITYLYGAFDCIFLSVHVCNLEWIYTL